MTPEEFKALVAEMREAQRSYFRERTPQCLSKSRELERVVDRVLRDELIDKTFGPDLFAGQEP